MNRIIQGTLVPKEQNERNSESISPQISNTRKVKKRYQWTLDQNVKYSSFILKHQDAFNSEQLRKSTRIFSQLSAFMCTRTTPQVKSHHQKMIQRFKQIKNIAKYIEWKIQQSTLLQNKEGIMTKPESETMIYQQQNTTQVREEPHSNTDYKQMVQVQVVDGYLSFLQNFDDL